MLNPNDLKSQIKAALSEYLPAAIETCILNRYPIRSEQAEEEAKSFAKTFDELVSEPLAESLANAIDYYVKNITITGTIITVGGMFSQVANIAPAPMPATAGKIPNTLGIS